MIRSLEYNYSVDLPEETQEKIRQRRIELESTGLSNIEIEELIVMEFGDESRLKLLDSQLAQYYLYFKIKNNAAALELKQKLVTFLNTIIDSDRGKDAHGFSKGRGNDFYDRYITESEISELIKILKEYGISPVLHIRGKEYR